MGYDFPNRQHWVTRVGLSLMVSVTCLISDVAVKCWGKLVTFRTICFQKWLKCGLPSNHFIVYDYDCGMKLSPPPFLCFLLWIFHICSVLSGLTKSPPFLLPLPWGNRRQPEDTTETQFSDESPSWKGIQLSTSRTSAWSLSLPCVAAGKSHAASACAAPVFEAPLWCPRSEISLTSWATGQRSAW